MPPLRASIMPSDYYPDYFKLDLGMGSPSPHPIAASLDDLSFQLLVVSHQQAYSLNPRFFDGEQQRNVLTMHGFVYEKLGSSELTELSDLLPDLFAARGTLLAIELLGRLYFGDISVTRGRPSKRDRLTEKQGFPIAAIEPADGHRIVFIQLDNYSPLERIEEFQSNASLLIPMGYCIIVANPKEAAPPAVPFMDLSGAVRLEKRRL